MNVSLTPKLEVLIQDKVESGYYNNASEVVREALRLLETRDRQLTWLRVQMADSLQQVERGEIFEDTDEFWADLDREVDDRLARFEVPNPDVCP